VIQGFSGVVVATQIGKLLVLGLYVVSYVFLEDLRLGFLICFVGVCFKESALLSVFLADFVSMNLDLCLFWWVDVG
jgi:hypothetical protein